MEMDNKNQNQLSVVWTKRQLKEIYKGGNITDLNVIEQVCKLPNKSFFDVVHEAKKLRDFQNDQYFKGHLAPVLVKISALAGIKTEIDSFTKKDIMNMLFSRFKQLSTADIWKAFELERYFVYDEITDHFQLFNSTYIAKVLDKYLIWKRNEQISISYTPPIDENNLLPEMTESNKKEIMTNAIIKYFEYFKENGKLPDEPVTHIFDELYDRGFIVKPETDKNKVTEYFIKQQNKAYIQLKEEYKSQIKTSDLSIRDSLRQKIKELELGDKGAVIVRMKRNILFDFFNKYKNDNDFINRLNI